MNGEITLTLNASAEFTRKGYGAHVENIGGCFDRITKADTTRGVTLPLTSAGMAMATQLVDKFHTASTHTRCRGFVGVEQFSTELPRGEDVGAFMFAMAWRMGEEFSRSRTKRDVAQAIRDKIDSIDATKQAAEDWRTVALALARQQS